MSGRNHLYIRILCLFVIRVYKRIRFILIVLRFLPIALSYLRDRHRFLIFGSKRDADGDLRKYRAKKLHKTLLKLGPTFIKLGQVLSVRPDVLPSEYIDELSKLQDEVPPVESDKIIDVIEKELDGDINDLFDSFEEESISAASLGQVHVAEINGAKVAVKVRRPDIEKKVEADIWSMQRIKPILMRYIDDARSFSLKTLVEEFSESIEEEMDYQREFQELQIVRDNFKDYDDLIIPRPIKTHSSDKVITMRFVDGIKIDNIDKIREKGIDTEELATRIQEIYFEMVVEDGVFHADPHPGNLAVKPDGRLVIYDFGMTGRVSEEQQKSIVELYVAISRDEIDKAIDAMIDLDVLNDDADRDVIKEGLKLAIKDAKGESVSEQQIQDVLESAQSQLYEFPFRIPPNFALLLRVSTVANAVCYQLNPEIDFIGEVTEILKSKGYVRKVVLRYAQDSVSNSINQLIEYLKLPKEASRASKRINEGRAEVELTNCQETKIQDSVRDSVNNGVVIYHLSSHIILLTVLSVVIISTDLPQIMSLLPLLFASMLGFIAVYKTLG